MKTFAKTDWVFGQKHDYNQGPNELSCPFGSLLQYDTLQKYNHT